MSKFLHAFDPANEKHVTWLRNMFSVLDEFDKLGNDTIELVNTMQSTNIEQNLQSNPLGIDVSSQDIFDFPLINFLLSVKYSRAVMAHNAWIPPPL